MATVGSYQAKTHLPRLLGRVARGERITITRHGTPVAMLVPPDSAEPPKKKRRPAGEAGDYAAEMRWLDEHRERYVGQWVALDGGRLLAHGGNAREVYKAARRSGVRLPLVVQVEPANQAFWGGW